MSHKYLSHAFHVTWLTWLTFNRWAKFMPARHFRIHTWKLVSIKIHYIPNSIGHMHQLHYNMCHDIVALCWHVSHCADMCHVSHMQRPSVTWREWMAYLRKAAIVISVWLDNYVVDRGSIGGKDVFHLPPKFYLAALWDDRGVFSVGKRAMTLQRMWTRFKDLARILHLDISPRRSKSLTTWPHSTCHINTQLSGLNLRNFTDQFPLNSICCKYEISMSYFVCVAVDIATTFRNVVLTLLVTNQ